MTLNRQVGNISIGGFTSGGAQSVNVSLSGSTLTVNVDGHSDSVNLSSTVPPSGSLNIYTTPQECRCSQSVTQSRRTLYSPYGDAPIETLNGPVSVHGAIISNVQFSSDSGYPAPVNITSSSLISATIANYNLQGSGTIDLYGKFSIDMATISYSGNNSTSTSFIRYTVQNGRITQATFYGYMSYSTTYPEREEYNTDISVDVIACRSY